MIRGAEKGKARDCSVRLQIVLTRKGDRKREFVA